LTSVIFVIIWITFDSRFLVMFQNILIDLFSQTQLVGVKDILVT